MPIRRDSELKRIKVIMAIDGDHQVWPKLCEAIVKVRYILEPAIAHDPGIDHLYYEGAIPYLRLWH